jgi:predicted GTPase
MTRLRLIFLTLLFLAPFAVMTGFGVYFLWKADLMWVWWPLLGSMGLAYFLAWRWTRKRGMLPATDIPPPEYWTDRDRIAWEKVDAKARSFQSVTLEQISTPQHYADLAVELATEMGNIYNPGDPFGHLTLPEVLACIELAAADLNGMVQRYVPGVHLIRLKDTKRAQKAYDWYKTGMDVYWAGAVLYAPVAAGLRYLASRKVLGGLMNRIQDNLIQWFHTAFIHQLGRYLIELNSGRLRVGVQRYREILAHHQEPPAAPPEPIPPEALGVESPPVTKPITLAVLGQVKAGKSSLANQLLGKHVATVDRLPVPGGTRYEMTLPGGQAVSLLDSSGYGERVSDEDFAAAVEASRDADLIILVTAATSPGRKPDVDLFDRLKEWFAGKPHLRMPPVVVVVNQVDLLSPKSEWNPPYDWKEGKGAKETNIRDCIEAVKEQIGTRAAVVVPTCAREGETLGIVDGVVPALVSHLDHARGAAVLKAFEADASARPIGKVIEQVGNVAQSAMSALGELFKKK